jgi:hypothetical protein
MLPPALTALLEEIRACERAADRLVADLDDDVVNRQPPQGGWSIAQCLEHLTLINPIYLRGWHELTEEARRHGADPFRGLRPTLAARWFLRMMEPPSRMKMRAPRAISPSARVPREGLLERYVASHAPYLALVQSAAGVDVNRIVAPNALVPAVRMRLSTVLLVIPAHDRRHLWQASQVRRAVTGE